MIPLVKESAEYSTFVRDCCNKFQDSNYRRSNRINLVYRFDSKLYDDFEKSYVSGECGGRVIEIDGDIFERRLPLASVIRFLIKVLLHTVFRFCGYLQFKFNNTSQIRVGRKCYVDDIFKVFEVEADRSPLYLVHPFPIRVMRQVKFVIALKKRKIPFVFAGQVYVLKDVLKLLASRKVADMYSAETRSSILYAKKWAGAGIVRFELSDEFDIACLSLGRALNFFGIHTVNKAHGIGKYYPQVSFNEFFVMNSKMSDYYQNVSLNGRVMISLFNESNVGGSKYLEMSAGGKINLIWVSQVFEGSGDYLAACEAVFLKEYAFELRSKLDGVSMFVYRPHPNSLRCDAPDGWVVSSNNYDGDFNIYISFFSTVFIDPEFLGRKYLLEWEGINPSLAFDAGKFVLTRGTLVSTLMSAISAARQCDRIEFDASGNVAGSR